MANKNLIVGILLLVLGVLVLLEKLGVGDIVRYLGIALVVVGILVLLNTLPGGKLIGIASLVLGILLLAQIINFGLPKAVTDMFWILNLVIGIVLVALGILKIMGKR